MMHCSNLTLPGPVENNLAYYSGLSNDGNCESYCSRPDVCRKYTCAWKLGYGNEEDRPDRCLILFDDSHGIDNAFEAKPLKDGQELTKEGEEVINRMSKSIGKPIIVLNFYERRIRSIVGLPIVGQ